VPEHTEAGGSGAALAFGALCALAGAMYLVVGREQWFFSDEWDYLAARRLFDVDDLMRAHNGHWHTVPVVVFRGMWNVVGLRSYLPYQALVVALHLASAALVRRVALQGGASPWIATAAAAVFVLFGAGAENIVFAVQITFVGSLALGLAQLALAGHDGPIGRRDVLALACGALALMCSGVGVTTAIVVGVAVVIRRGWRAATFHTASLALLYAAWWSAYGRTGTPWSAPGDVVAFVAAGVDEALTAMSQVRVLGWLMVLVMIGGLTVRWRGRRWADVRPEASVVAGTLVGAIGFLVVSGTARASVFGTESAREARYFPLVVALLLPALAVAVDGLRRRSPLLGAVAVVGVLIGVPGNLASLSSLEDRALMVDAARQLILTLPRVPEAADAPADLRPGPEWYNGPDLTIGWLRDGVAEGWLPAPAAPNPAVEAAASFRLSLYQTDVDGDRSGCQVLPQEPLVRVVETGDELRLDGGSVRLTRIDVGATPGEYMVLNPNRGTRVEVLNGPMTLSITSEGRNGDGEICGGPD
jgi:hypothetical protein